MQISPIKDNAIIHSITSECVGVLIALDPARFSIAAIWIGKIYIPKPDRIGAARYVLALSMMVKFFRIVLSNK